MKILIPTCKPRLALTQLDELEAHSPGHEIVTSCLPASAAINRNSCLDHIAPDEVAVMLDDDIGGFDPGWIDDLTRPLSDESVVMVSARLLTPEGVFGPTCSRCYDATPEEIEIKSNGECILPTAAIAFRWRGHLFDEHYLGSGFEDSDWCHQYLRDDPAAKFLQSNRCRLIHWNEMKEQGRHWKHNRMYFHTKWNGRNRIMRTTTGGIVFEKKSPA